MPELPEVETVRRSLEKAAQGRKVVAVRVFRSSVIAGSTTQGALLAGCTLQTFARHGKELLITGRFKSNGGKKPRGGAVHPCLGVHLGMTGSLRYVPHGSRQGPAWPRPAVKHDKHIHIVWYLDNDGQIEFRDPRRFGGVWTFSSAQACRQARWAHLGADAQRITADQLHECLRKTRRAIKAALLDQRLVAGLGNIYADELLFACRIHPLTKAHRLSRATVCEIVRRMRPLLVRAIRANGSTLSDAGYLDAYGRPGRFQFQHLAYGRIGEPCSICKTSMHSIRVGGRTSTFCPACQIRNKVPMKDR
jgi:formamidopyrimidine-DNA glycosylase